MANEHMDTIFLGLTGEELTRLMQKGAIGFNKAQTGFACHVIICYSETEAGLVERLRENGAKVVIDPSTDKDAPGFMSDKTFRAGKSGLALPPTPGVPHTWPDRVLMELDDPSKQRGAWRICCRDPFNELMVVAANPSKLDLRIMLEAAGFQKERDLSIFRELWHRA